MGEDYVNAPTDNSRIESITILCWKIQPALLQKLVLNMENYFWLQYF